MLNMAVGLLSVQEITLLLFTLALLLGLARLLGEISKSLRQPAVLGEIMAGILLGPTLLGWISPDIYEALFPATGNVAVSLEAFATVAVVLLLLVAGLELDLSVIWRQGKAALSVSLTGIIFPFGIGFLMAYFLPSLLGRGEDAQPIPFALFVGIAMSITALPIIAKIMIDLNMLKSDMGMLIMSAAMVDDLLGWMGFAIVLALISTDTAYSGGGVAQTIGLTLIFVLGTLTIGRWLFHRTLPYIQAHSSWPNGVLGFVLVAALLGAAFTEMIGVHAIFGAFIVAVALGDSRHLRQRTRDTIHQFVMNIFAPIFFATIGLHVNFVASFGLLTTVVVLVIAIIVKVGGCYLGASWAGMAPRESLAVGFAMSARGAMEIVLATLARNAELITDELFVAIVIMALVTSLMSGPVMQRLMRRTQHRTLANVLSEKQFIPWLTAITNRDAIAELCQRAGMLLNRDGNQLLEHVWNREQIMQTGIGDGVAVPHARLADLPKPLVIVGRSKAGVDFDAGDGQPANIICLLLTPADNQMVQIELLGMVARAFHDAAARQDAMVAENFTEFLAALKLSAASNEHAQEQLAE